MVRRHWRALDGPRDHLRGHRIRARVHKAATSRRVVALSIGRDTVARAFSERAPFAIRSPYSGAPFGRCRVAPDLRTRTGAVFARDGDACGNVVVGRVAGPTIASKKEILPRRGPFFEIGTT